MKLRKIKDSLEGFFYKVRLNIAWQRALSSQEVVDFNELMRSAIERQILNFAKVGQINRIIGISKAVKELTDDLLLPEIEKLWIPLLDLIESEEIYQYHVWASNKGGQIAVDKLGSKEQFQITNPDLLKNIEAKTIPLVNTLDKTTKEWVGRTIQEGLRDGLSHVQIAEMIRDEARRVAQIRADLISENEATLSMGEMEVMVYKESGIKYTTWVTARDELTCPLCSANEEAGKVSVGEAFPSGAIAPPQHGHCRCFVRPFITNDLDIWYGA